MYREPNNMTSVITYMLQNLAALLAGALIGIGFGLIQTAARRRNEKKQAEGKGVTSGWSLIPGSGVRVAFLLIALVVIQIVCPILFREGTKWWVSGGLVGGYGFMLYRQLRERLDQNK